MLDKVETIHLYEFLRYMKASDATVRELIQLTERVVHQFYPHAKPLFTSDKRGAITHVGIYDVPLLLNERGQFRPIQQFAPQLMSKTREWKENHHTTLRLKILYDVWLDALFFAARKYPELHFALQNKDGLERLAKTE